jgi:hypothetical protein
VTSTPPYPQTSYSHTPKLTSTDLIALLLILLAALAFVWPLFIPGWIIPQGGGDLVSFLWPIYRYAARHFNLQSLISNPQSLLWNPTLYSGAPFAADNQTGLFYPPNLFLFFLFPDLPYQALEALVAFHLFLASAGMYLLMRFELQSLGFWKLEVGIFPALAFMASDVFITHLGNYNIVAVSAYLPLIFLCLRQSLVSSPPVSNPLISNSLITNNQVPITNIRWATLTGLLLGLAALAGHAQMTFILAFACAGYGLYELILQRHYRVILLGMLAALVAFGLAAIALLPAIEMLRYTARAALDYGEASRWSLPPLGLAGMISPLVFGRGPRDFWPPWDRVELGYMGLTTLLVVCRLQNLKRWPLGFWLLGFGIFSLFVAFGKYTPVHYLLYKFIPGFASLRVPARFILLTNFALAFLSGYALASFYESDESKSKGRRWAEVVVLGFWVLGFGLLIAAPLSLSRQPVWQPIVLALGLFFAVVLLFRFKPALLPLLLFVELFAFGAFVEIDRADPNAGYTRGPAVDYLLAQEGPTRIDVSTSQWQPDAPAVFGLESITGISNPLALAHYDRYYWSVGYRGSPQYNFLSAQFVVADKNSPPADSTFVPVFNEDPDVDVYLNTNAMPRVHLIYDPIYVDSADAAFAAIHDPAFDTASQVVLESERPRASVTPPPAGSPSSLFYTAYAPGRFTVIAQSPSPAYLVLSEVWYPGWVAVVDGEPTPIIRANSAFMAVQLVDRHSLVEFRFTSPMLVGGAMITLVTLVAALAFLAWKRS